MAFIKGLSDSWSTCICCGTHGSYENYLQCSFRLAQLASFAHTLQSTELASVGLSDFPMHNVVNIVRIMVSTGCYHVLT